MTQRVNIDIQRELWREVSIMAAYMNTTKRDFVAAALQEKIDREQKKLEK